MKKIHSLRPAIAPLLFAVFPTLILYVHNTTQAWPSIMVTSLLYSVIFGILSGLFFLILFRDRIKTSIMTSIWLIAFFSYGHAFLFLAQQHIFDIIPIGAHTFLLGLYLGILGLSFVFLFFTQRNMKVGGQFLMVMSLSLLVLNIGRLVPFEINRQLALRKLEKYKQTHFERSPITNQDSATYPDVYYLIFDRYGSNQVLAKYFGYDNQPFLEQLRQKEFFVATQSAANYPATYQSLSSSLNMEHLTFLTEVLGKEYSDQTVVYQKLLHDNAVVNFLKARGYQYYHFGDSWEPTKQSDLATKNQNAFISFNEFNLFIYENTMLNPVLGKLGSKQLFTGVEKLLKSEENLEPRVEGIMALADKPEPKIVFAHFLLPHPPYLFTKDCQPMEFEAIRRRSDQQGYLDQTDCANSIMNRIATEVLAKSNRPVVIIYQSDEGPFLPADDFPNGIFAPEPNQQSLDIHAHILNTFYLSDRTDPHKTANYEEVGLTQTLTPVNTFRLLFNYYFGTTFSLKENRTFIFTDNKQPHTFTEITNNLMTEGD